MASRWLRDGLDKKYLSKSRMDVGAREAMTTITGYVGFVVAALIGLTIAGVSFSNLAIVAGALSLGIGFGLQNIVNNFVSGIILLFERPIKAGDWIVTGTTEGYVKKIRVRSTEVQTFDRSEVIVPNSELVANQVTNWTLRDKYGRIKIDVGVAYGSDTELVKKLLESVTEDVPEIVHNRSTLPVKVLFLGFGESTLDFQLRFYIFDIGYILDVKSELHFAIDKAFRENDIEIAFPQRDIHIKSGALVTASKTDD
jgi:small-conductance mechanosensitive channel